VDRQERNQNGLNRSHIHNRTYFVIYTQSKYHMKTKYRLTTQQCILTSLHSSFLNFVSFFVFIKITSMKHILYSVN